MYIRMATDRRNYPSAKEILRVAEVKQEECTKEDFDIF